MNKKLLIIFIVSAGILTSAWFLLNRNKPQVATVSATPEVTATGIDKTSLAKNNSQTQAHDDELAKLNQQINTYSEAIKANSNDNVALNERATLYMKKGYYDGAVIDYSALIDKDKKDLKSYFYRAIAQTKRGNISQALDDYKVVVTLDPNNYLAYNNIGLLYLDKKNTDKALDAFNKAIKIDAKYAESYYNRSLLLDSEKNFVDSQKDLEQALTLHNKTDLEFEIKIRYRLAIELYNQDKHHEALEQLNAVIKLAPNDAKLYNLRALTHDQLGNKQQAFDDCSKAQEISLHSML